LLTNAYFVPDHILLNALKAAAGRGVDVQILLPWISNHAATDWVARGYFTDCLRAGIRIFAYKAMMHAKTCTIDGQWSTIGTANLDRLSSVGNYEINVEIYSAELARQMETVFAHDKAFAVEIARARWSARPWYVKLSERILAPLRVLM
jgi:cardiolipin synthase